MFPDKAFGLCQSGTLQLYDFERFPFDPRLDGTGRHSGHPRYCGIPNRISPNQGCASRGGRIC